MPLNDTQALDSIDRYIKVGARMAKLPILTKPEYRPAVEDLYQITRKLLVANENMARWLNLFLQFDFRQPDARGQFLKVAGDYRTTKSSQGFHDMKFSCGDIWIIYDRNIAAKLPQMFPDDREAAETARTALLDLTDADNDMVAFIYDTVVAGIDAFVRDAESCINRSDLNGAETARLEFKVASGDLSARLERFAAGLADLLLTYARLAQRPVTLT
jgi:hypothetical protein